MLPDAYGEQAVRRVTELLRPEAKAELDKLSIPRAGNKVYRVPLDGTNGGFVVLKLPPKWGMELRRQWKMLLRNLVYGEHCVEYWGKKRAKAEIARYHDWHAAGLPVPALVQFPRPHVRVIEGLPYPSCKAILEDQSISIAHKLHVIGAGMVALSAQHRLALARGSAGLVHPEPNPKNILFDRPTQKTYWLDLEHPGEYARMSVDQVAVRSLRFYLFGVLYKLPGQMDEVLDLAMDHYEPRRLLWSLADNLESSLRRLPLRLARRLGRAKREVAFREQIAAGLRQRLAERGPAA